MPRFNSTTSTFALAMLAITGVAQAQEYDDPTLLDRLLVTDGRTPVEQQKSGHAFTVITGEQLERNQVQYVSDALRQVPGVAVSQTGASGGVTQIRMRGAEANHVLVMIDGVEASETSTGEYDFGGLLAEDIDRIEVLRGPQSAFWGSNATAGVINIITRRGRRDGFSGTYRAELGSDGTRLLGLSTAGGGENWDVAVSGVFQQADGFNISDFGDEEDGSRNTTLNGKLFVDLAPGLTFDANLRHVNRKSEGDDQDFVWGSPSYGMVIDTDDKSVADEWLGGAGLTSVTLDGALTQKLRYGGTQSRREYLKDGSLVSYTEGARKNFSYQASLAFDTPWLNAHHTLTGGYEWEGESFSPSHVDEIFERRTNSFVGEYRGEFLDQFYLNAAIRQDYNDAFADAVTYSVSGAWRVPGTATRIHASIGTGVTNPTFYEQFGYIPNDFVGNPNLTPERSFGWDAGVEQGFFDGALVVDVTYFEQNLTDEIAVDYSNYPISTVYNADGESRREGVEVAATVNLSNGFTATGSYTYIKSLQQLVAGTPSTEELRRPRHQGALNVTYAFPDERTRVFAEAVYNGEMFDSAFVPSLPSTVTLKDYTVVNLGGSYRISDKTEVYARLDNAFDEQYEEIFGYNSKGRTAYIGLKGRF